MSLNHLSSGKILLLNFLSTIDEKLTLLEKSSDKTTFLLINTNKTVKETVKLAEELKKSLDENEKQRIEISKLNLNFSLSKQKNMSLSSKRNFNTNNNNRNNSSLKQNRSITPNHFQNTPNNNAKDNKSRNNSNITKFTASKDPKAKHLDKTAVSFKTLKTYTTNKSNKSKLKTADTSINTSKSKISKNQPLTNKKISTKLVKNSTITNLKDHYNDKNKNKESKEMKISNITKSKELSRKSTNSNLLGGNIKKVIKNSSKKKNEVENIIDEKKSIISFKNADKIENDAKISFRSNINNNTKNNYFNDFKKENIYNHNNDEFSTPINKEKLNKLDSKINAFCENEKCNENNLENIYDNQNFSVNKGLSTMIKANIDDKDLFLTNDQFIYNTNNIKKESNFFFDMDESYKLNSNIYHKKNLSKELNVSNIIGSIDNSVIETDFLKDDNNGNTSMIFRESDVNLFKDSNENLTKKVLFSKNSIDFHTENKSPFHVRFINNELKSTEELDKTSTSLIDLNTIRTESVNKSEIEKLFTKENDIIIQIIPFFKLKDSPLKNLTKMTRKVILKLLIEKTNEKINFFQNKLKEVKDVRIIYFRNILKKIFKSQL